MPRATTTAMLAGLAASPAAMAQILTWNNPTGGFAHVAANWSPALAPTVAADLVWGLTATYPVTFTAATPASHSHVYHDGEVTLSLTSPHSTGAFTLGSTRGDNPLVVLTSGSLTASGPVIVGQAANSIAALRVQGDGAVFTQTGASPLTLGSNGIGNLGVLSGGSVTTADRLLTGTGGAGQSLVVVDGRINGNPSTLRVNGTGESRLGQNGQGALELNHGGLAAFAGPIGVGTASGGLGSLSLVGTGPGTCQLLGASTITLGRNSTAGAAAGIGQMVVAGSSVVSVQGIVVGGDPDGGSGRLIIESPDATVVCHELSVGGGASGDLQLRAGELIVDQGPMTFVDPLTAIAGATVGTATLTLRNGVTHTQGTPIQIGTIGSAALRLLGGTDFEIQSAGLALGINAGSQGAVSVSASSVNILALNAGFAGRGDVLVEAGSSVTLRASMSLGQNAGSQGTFTSRGSATTSARGAAIGGLFGQGGVFIPGGHGEFTLESGSTFDTDGPIASSAGSPLAIRLSTLTSSALVELTGPLTMEGGTLRAPLVRLHGVNAVSGLIDATVVSSTPVEATGALTLGNGAAGAVQGLTLVGGNSRVDIRDGIVAGLSGATVAGTVLASPTGFRLAAGGVFSGFGTVIGDFESRGTITASGAGLVFQGRLSNPTGGPITGSRVQLAGQFEGGTTNGACRWDAAPGSALRFTQDSAVGVASADGFVCRGTLDVSGVLTVTDSDGITLGPTCTLRGGSIRHPVVTVGRTGGAADRLRGTGAIVGQVINTGVISPGMDAGDPVGVLTFDSFRHVVSPAQGNLEIDIDGPGPDQADRVNVRFTAALAGSLTLRVAPGFLPPNGFRRTLLSATAITGAFGQADLPPRWHLEQTQTQVDAVYCSADFNADGFVDFFDYDDFVACFETGSCGAGDADFNQDGFADFFDYDDFVLAFEQGC